jgi:hypothetical protein
VAEQVFAQKQANARAMAAEQSSVSQWRRQQVLCVCACVCACVCVCTKEPNIMYSCHDVSRGVAEFDENAINQVIHTLSVYLSLAHAVTMFLFGR